MPASSRHLPVITCGCRCIACKSQQLDSRSFVAQDGYDDIHHTCLSCGTHFDHLDGQTYTECEICDFPSSQKEKKRT